MLDFKAELNKFHPLPEQADIKKYTDSSIEDIMDILRTLKSDK